MFIDALKLKLIAGKGGNGIVAWRREKYLPKGGPYGGNGGKGGCVIIRCNDQLESLDHLRNTRILKAKPGGSGSTNNRQGARGKDLIINVPTGTLLRDAATQTLIYDFTEGGEEITLCEGGKGGKGNTFFKTPTNQAPNKCTPGLMGETKEVELELKLIAHVGFVGFPNAGKSTLLSQIGKFPFKTGAYPFTTLHPNLSTIEFNDYSRLTIADIPGIIGDAHKDRGLGLSFLRHIERTNVLLFIIDVSDFNQRDPLEDYQTLRNELASYSPTMLDKPYLVALNKTDLEGAQDKIALWKKASPCPPENLYEISAQSGAGVEELVTRLKRERNQILQPLTNH